MSGALDAGTAPELRDRLVDVIDGQGNRNLVIEASALVSIDPAGISVLVDALKRLHRNAGSLVLSGPGEHIVRALAAAGVEKAFAVTPAWAHPAYDHGRGNDSRPLRRSG